MTLLWQAVRAAAVDTLAVVLVVWLVLGLPVFSYYHLHDTLTAGVTMPVLPRHQPERSPRAIAWPDLRSQTETAADVSQAARGPHTMRPHAAVWLAAPGSWWH
jgi:hypothetical protein